MTLPEFLDTYPIAATTFGLAALGLVAFVADVVTKFVLLRMARHLAGRVALFGEGLLLRYKVVQRLAYIVPALILQSGVRLVPHLAETPRMVIENTASSFIVMAAAAAVSGVLNIINELWSRRPDAASRPIKGYIQLLKILLYSIASIVAVALLIERSPMLLLSSLGALMAVLTLVFKDTLLSLVASIQLTTNDMVRVGDWIEMPQVHADGDVIDIALHTVKVQNWDKTITTIPTYRLISDSFRNWRGMRESGGRRIKRAINIDLASIRFLTPEERAGLHRFTLLRDYLDAKQAEIDAWNASHPDRLNQPVNARRLTNIGCFRAYVQAYLKAHPGVRQDMTLMVRQMPPQPTGLPLEIYCFAATVVWAEYEGIQSDIFDHLFAILPEFGLRVFQQPTGWDIQRGLENSTDAPAAALMAGIPV